MNLIDKAMIENKELEQLIRKHSAYDQKIYENTSIVRDLNIDNKQAKEFIDAYAKAFNIDISSFHFAKYFYVDNSNSTDRPVRKELTIADLERGIIVGELNEDVISLDINDSNQPLQLTTKKIIMGVIIVVAVTALLATVAIFL